MPNLLETLMNIQFYLLEKACLVFWAIGVMVVKQGLSLVLLLDPGNDLSFQLLVSQIFKAPIHRSSLLLWYLMQSLD